MANELPILGHSAPPVPILPVSQKQPAVVKEIIVTRASAPAPVKPTPTSKATQRLKKPSDGKRSFVPKPITTVYRKVPFSAKRAAALDRLNQDYRQDVRDSFRIDYADLTGQKKVFIFDLLPSIENRASNKMGSIEVPEAKPGILRRVDTKHKNIIIPGGTPVVQSIGIDKALLNLVGCFTGADDSYDKVPDVNDLTDAKLDNNVLMSAVGESKDPSDSAIKASEKFYEDVVIPMTEVKVTIESSNGPGEGIEARVYKGVIVTFKEYAVRQNKTFYTIDLLITEYPRAPEPATLTQVLDTINLIGQAGASVFSNKSTAAQDLAYLKAAATRALSASDDKTRIQFAWRTPALEALLKRLLKKYPNNKVDFSHDWYDEKGDFTYTTPKRIREEILKWTEDQLGEPKRLKDGGLTVEEEKQKAQQVNNEKQLVSDHKQMMTKVKQAISSSTEFTAGTYSTLEEALKAAGGNALRFYREFTNDYNVKEDRKIGGQGSIFDDYFNDENNPKELKTKEDLLKWFSDFRNRPGAFIHSEG